MTAKELAHSYSELMYKQEINKLVNDSQQKEFYTTNQTAYSCTVAVWKEWFGQP